MKIIPPRAESSAELRTSSPGEAKHDVAALHRAVVAGVVALLRTARIHSPDNAVFDRPIEQLRSSITRVIEAEGRLLLVAVAQSFQINGASVAVDAGTLDAVRRLVIELKARGVGGMQTDTVPPPEDLRGLIWVLAGEPTPLLSEKGLPDRPLQAIRLLPWSELVERIGGTTGAPSTTMKLDGVVGAPIETTGTTAAAPVVGDAPSEPQADPRRRGLTAFARAVRFVQQSLESARVGTLVDLSPLRSTSTSLVDAFFENPGHMMGLTVLREDRRYLVMHHVNVALFMIGFSGSLGRPREELVALAEVALVHDLGMALLPREVALKRGPLDPNERALIDRTPAQTAQLLLQADPAGWDRALAVMEHKLPSPEGSGLAGRLLALCDAYEALTANRPFRAKYAPHLALELMTTELRARFDSALLERFVRTMSPGVTNPPRA